MLQLDLTTAAKEPLSVLAVGAHPDDIEIGAGGTLLTLAEKRAGLRVRYLVMTGTPERHAEARQAAAAFDEAGATKNIQRFVDSQLDDFLERKWPPLADRV